MQRHVVVSQQFRNVICCCCFYGSSTASATPTSPTLHHDRRPCGQAWLVKLMLTPLWPLVHMYRHMRGSGCWLPKFQSINIYIDFFQLNLLLLLLHLLLFATDCLHMHNCLYIRVCISMHICICCTFWTFAHIIGQFCGDIWQYCGWTRFHFVANCGGITFDCAHMTHCMHATWVVLHQQHKLVKA